MKVTLYSQDKLNLSYTGVFFSRALLDGYLDKVAVKHTFEIFDFYPLFDSDLFLSGYANDLIELSQLNYMKFTPDLVDENQNTFYAFIDSIEARNDGFMISYTLDVYHSFLPELGYELRYSVLGATRYPQNYKAGIYYNLPVGYKPTGLSIDRIDNIFSISLIAQIQIYRTVEASQIPIVETYMAGVGHLIRNADGSLSFTNKLATFDEGTLSEPLNAISEKMSEEQVWRSSDPGGLSVITHTGFYRVLNVYAIPGSLLYDKEVLNKDYIILKESPVSAEKPGGINISLAIMKDIDEIVFNKTIAKSKEFFTYKSIGIFSNLLPIDTSLNECNFDIKMIIHETGFNCIMRANNNISDITNDFAIDLLYNVNDASALQLQKMNKTINENNATAAKFNLMASIADIGYETAQGVGNSISVGAKGMSAFSKGDDFGLLAAGGKAISTQARTMQNVSHAINNALQSIVQQKNAELRANQRFMNWQAGLSYSKGFINAIYGIVIVRDIANEDLINESIEQFGYEIVDGYGINKIQYAPNATEDYVKFNIANVMNLTGEYAEIVKEILEKGVYVYYTS